MQWLAEFPGVWVLLALALYGLVNAIFQGYRLYRWGVRPGARYPLSLLVLVRNQEQQIEGFVRSLSALVRGRSAMLGRCELLLVDLASADDTPLILERLVQQDSYLRLVRLPAETPAIWLESALFLCRSSVTILVDLRGKVDATAVLGSLSRFW
jgi:hypothetical protein